MDSALKDKLLASRSSIPISVAAASTHMSSLKSMRKFFQSPFIGWVKIKEAMKS